MNELSKHADDVFRDEASGVVVLVHGMCWAWCSFLWAVGQLSRMLQSCAYIHACGLQKRPPAGGAAAELKEEAC